eukprot:scaffold3278_cov376-Prasinococcus_capsulatus_cf.AAC.1
MSRADTQLSLLDIVQVEARDVCNGFSFMSIAKARAFPAAGSSGQGRELIILSAIGWDHEMVINTVLRFLALNLENYLLLASSEEHCSQLNKFWSTRDRAFEPKSPLHCVYCDTSRVLFSKTGKAGKRWNLDAGTNTGVVPITPNALCICSQDTTTQVSICCWQELSLISRAGT